MIIKNYELEKINLLNHKIILFYGDNEGFKEEKIDEIYQKTKFEKFSYHEKDVLNNLENFFNTLFTKSFFETKKFIIIRNVTDKTTDIVKEIINKNLEETTIILNANILEKKSKIRNFFEKEESLICTPFYPDEFKSLNFIVQKFLREKKLKISQESTNLIIERSNGSREHLKRELEKIKLYALDKNEINHSEILKLTNLGKNYNISELVEVSLAKNINRLTKIINENNFSNEDSIIIIRTFLQKTKRLLNLSKNLRNETNLETVISNYKPTIFWKEKEVVKTQLKIWSEKNLNNLIYEINNTELLIKRNISISLNILFDFIFKNSKPFNN